jgi:hypothetical protein
MTNFDKREEGFEKKYALDEEQKFKAEARRNKLLGLWVAEKLGMSGDEANAYAREVVAADFEEAGDGDVVRKVMGDGGSGDAGEGGDVDSTSFRGVRSTNPESRDSPMRNCASEIAASRRPE